MSKNGAVSGAGSANVVQKTAVIVVAVLTSPIWVPICLLWGLLDDTDG